LSFLFDGDPFGRVTLCCVLFGGTGRLISLTHA
jgi:hypothetical protein